MNFADLALRNRTTTLVLALVLGLGGIVSYGNLSRLEDPEFTIKEALVFTPYPGATALEVEEEVSDRIERAVQTMGELKEVESKSDRGLSTVTVRIKDQYGKDALPQIWDIVRKKVGDVQGDLPPGAGPSRVNDDYGDVWGIFVAVYGADYSAAELKEFAKLLQRELLLVKDVAKIEFWGARTEAIYVEPDRDRMSQLGIPPERIAERLREKNIVSDAGHIRVGSEFLAVEPTGVFDSVEEFERLLLSNAGSERQVYLGDVADVRRGYTEPPTQLLRYDGHPAVGIGVSTVSGGNVVVMGDAIAKRVRELQGQVPVGVEFGLISVQSQAVTTAISGFLSSLLQAVAIVVVVLLVFMGLRSGLLIGFVLALTISGTFIFMGSWNVALERISLGALIIALGMLVDNAIVVVDGMLVRIEQGREPEDAAREVVGQTSVPLLGATAVAVMAFGAIGLSQDSTGEFCRSLFQVVLISLSLSWVTAVTVTPVVGVMVLRRPAAGAARTDPYDSGLYRRYRGVLRGCIRARGATLGGVVALFAVSLWGFGFVDQSFFPNSTRPQFMIDLWLPTGTHIEDTVEAVAEAERLLEEEESVTHVSSFVGAGGMRFLLTYSPEKLDSGYAQLLVDVDDYTVIEELLPRMEVALEERFPNSMVNAKKFLLGPGGGGKIQIRFRGPDHAALRTLAERSVDILRADPDAKGIRIDWRERVKVIRPVVAEEEASLAGIEHRDVAAAVRSGFEGSRVGVFREGDELLPIVSRAPEEERTDVASLQNLQIWSPAAGRTVPLRQVVSGFETAFENPVIQRLDRAPTITVHADPRKGQASSLRDRIVAQVEALPLPPDTELLWWGEYRDSARGQAGIAASLPFFLGAMVLIVIALFNALRQPLVIWLTVPLAIIGVTAGLLLTRQPFGFMSMLGVLSLSGMLIKNAIVLIDEIELQKKSKDLFEAILDSGVSRLRPVAMAALTTALGMIPLLFDAFFIAMAVTIIFGLMVATVLTMVVVPVLYATFFGVRAPDS